MDNKEIKNRIEEIQTELEELIENLNDTQSDFFAEQSEDLTGIKYLEDYFSEFADSSISVYCSDQEDYYREHTEECDCALQSMGYELKDFSDLYEAICRAGVCGWYEETYGELCEDNRLEDIKELQEELEDLQEQLEEGE